MANFFKEATGWPGSKVDKFWRRTGRKLGGERSVREFERSTGCRSGRCGKGNQATRYGFGNPDTIDNGLDWLIGKNSFRKCALYQNTDPRHCEPEEEIDWSDLLGTPQGTDATSMLNQLKSIGTVGAIGVGLVLVFMVAGGRRKKGKK